MYTVFFDNILVKEIKDGGVLVAASDKQIKAKVVAVGEGGKYPMKFKVGDIVYFPQFEGVKFESYWIVPQTFVLAKE